MAINVSVTYFDVRYIKYAITEIENKTKLNYKFCNNYLLIRKVVSSTISIIILL